jgi:phasin
MNTNANPKVTSSPSANAPQQLRGMAEKSAKQSKEIFEKIGSATTDAASVMQDCCSTALRGMQDYNGKVLEFAQENTKSYADFVQKLAGAKSPSEFVEVSSKHAQQQLETLAEQTKQLAALAQRVTMETAEPLKTGLAKMQDRVA